VDQHKRLAGAAPDVVDVDGTLQEQARRHLWMHFSRMGAYDAEHEIPIIVRGEGCYVYDEHGKRYLDGLSALFCVNIGHGRADIVQAGADQAKELGFFTNWSYAHPPAIELAATKIASLAPGDLNRVFFTSGGSEAVESAIKLARQYHKLTGKPEQDKLIARDVAYHGTSLGALSATGITSLREPFEPLTPAAATSPTPTPTGCRRVTAEPSWRRRSPTGSSSRVPTRSPP
jgi:adenosylmethionine-8-amino-7-oxononanoate aminotransferase